MRGAMLCTVLAGACTSTVLPPPPVDDPVEVFLLHEAMHVGVVLPPAADGAPFVEFGYGDWSYYALGSTGSSGSIAAALWPTAGALGRRTFAAGTAEQLRARATWVELSPLVVSRRRVDALREQLEAEFASGLAGVVAQPSFGFRFVPFDASYSLAWTCADQAAEWLRALGCEVWWAPVRVSLSVGAR